MSEPFGAEKVPIGRREALKTKYGYNCFPADSERHPAHMYCDNCGFDISHKVTLAIGTRGEMLFQTVPLLCEACLEPLAHPLTEEEIAAIKKKALEEMQKQRAQAGSVIMPHKRLVVPT